MKNKMSDKARRFARHYDIFCREANTLKTYQMSFDEIECNWDKDIPDMLEFFSVAATRFKHAKGLTDEQLIAYINDRLVETCEAADDDLLILFAID